MAITKRFRNGGLVPKGDGLPTMGEQAEAELKAIKKPPLWTIVLDRSFRLSNHLNDGLTANGVSERLYVAVGIRAATYHEAIAHAKDEARLADGKDLFDLGRRFRPNHDDYKMVLVFKGSHNPYLFGFQAH